MQPDRPSTWQCPDCGRRFVRRTREHSCEVTSVDHHLARASEPVRQTFAALCSMLTRIAPFRLVPLKTMITLSGRTNFGGITVRWARLDVGFFLPRLESDSRIARVERISPRKIAHHVDLATSADVDTQLESWFREAMTADSER